MEPKFSITIEPVKGLVAITMAGLFDADTVQRMAHDMIAAYASLRCAPNDHLTLVDISACKLQLQPQVEAFRSLIEDPRTRSRKLAVVTGASPARMQIRRVLARPDAACFADRTDALKWLFDDAQRSVAA